MFLLGNFYNFYMDISDKLMYIKSDTCPPLYRYLGVYRRLRSACPPHADEAAVSCPHRASPKFKMRIWGGLFDKDIIGL